MRFKQLASFATAAILVSSHCTLLHAAAEADADTVKLEMEVDALTALNDLHLTAEQTTTLKGMITDTAGKLSDPPTPITADHKAALEAARTALLGKDQKKIEDADDKLDAFQDKADSDSDPDVDQSEPAKEKAANFLKILSPAQVANYISQNSEDVHDPVQVLLDAVHHARGQSDDDFEALEDDASEDIRNLHAGPHPEKPIQIVAKVKHLLERVHHMSADDYKSQQAALEDEARQVVGTSDPVACLRHWLENEFADLLSNPQLGLAINEMSGAK